MKWILALIIVLIVGSLGFYYISFTKEAACTNQGLKMVDRHMNNIEGTLTDSMFAYKWGQCYYMLSYTDSITQSISEIFKTYTNESLATCVRDQFSNDPGGLCKRFDDTFAKIFN